MTISQTDLLVISAVAVIAAFPVIKSYAAKAYALVGKKNPANPDAVEQWRQKWTALLITLGREIEAGEGGLSNQTQALILNRELMWEIIGGDQEKSGAKTK